MKKIFNFKKEIPFDENISNVTSISLDCTITEQENGIEGTFIIDGSYKTHELSLNKKDFKFEVPFEDSIDNLKEGTVNIEIDDFTYDFEENNLSVDIDYCLTYEENEIADEFNEEEFERFLSDHEVDIVNLTEESEENEENEVKLIEETAPITDERKELNEEEVIEEEEVKELEEIQEVENEPEIVSEEVREINIEPAIEEEKEDATTTLLSNINKEEKYITYHVYVCESDDTFDSIADKFKTTKEEIREYNEIDNIEYGRKIIIPVKDE